MHIQFRRTVASVAVLMFSACASTARGQARQPAQIAFEAGKQYAAQGLYDQAIAKFREAIAADPRFALARMNLGVAFIQKGRDYYTTAREHLEIAATMPEGKLDPLCWYNLTVIYTLTGIYDKAFEALDRTLRLGFKDFDALRTDKDLTELRRKPEFRKILERYNVFL